MKSALIIAVAFASPIVWFTSHWAGFALAPVTCTAQSNMALWLVAIIALLLVGVSGVTAWAQWSHRQEDGAKSQATSGTMPGWLAMSGVVLAGSFFIVIVAQTIPTLILRGCE